ncbi:unnamed protein product [Lactuca virosa]|uniref:Retrotransposon gag domain-containing protein n=1 Tax=Lactuca virosa TaxID=75947 RepID=A0AAU9P5I8_9ASTR|nr:unnamed protein product [Lactuca virosa]
MRWISDVEGCFFTCSCPAEQKVRCALNLLRSGAKDWWRLATGSYTDDQRAAVTWEQFRDMFRARYIPRVERERLAQEFLSLRQDGESVTEITRMFAERAMFCPKFASEQAQMTRYLSMLKTDIRQFVSTQRCDTLLELQETARRRELEIEQKLREQRQAPAHSQPAPKRSKTADTRTGGQQSRTCGKCGNGHFGVGHLKANCPLLAAKPAQAPAPTTLRITDGRPVRAEPPKAQGRAFQLTAEEARAAPDVVAGMFLSFISFPIFDGASRSFVSQSFSREFSVPVGELECPLRVSIANEHGVSASSVYRGCDLEIFGVSFPIDLIPIPMGEVCMIVGMDWLSRFGAMIDCEGQRVVVRSPRGGELIVYGEGTRVGMDWLRVLFSCQDSTVHSARVCGLSSVCGRYASQGSDSGFRCTGGQGVRRCVSRVVARDTSGEAGRVQDRPGARCGPYR